MSKTAIIIGATGLTGGLLLDRLLKDDRYQTIKLFSRNFCNIKHSKIKEHIVDMFELEKQQHLFIADVVFCCIGTTQAKTPDKEQYLKIDYGIPVTVASLCTKMSIDTLVVISALGANKNSKIFYNRMKGRMEEDVFNAKIKNTYMLQPSLISGKRDEKRPGEQFVKKLMSVINIFLVGRFKKYRSIHPEAIVNTMVWLAHNDYESGKIPSNEIRHISDSL